MSNVVGESDEASSDFRRLVASDLAFVLSVVISCNIYDVPK
jgi:hypothetical protein